MVNKQDICFTFSNLGLKFLILTRDSKVKSSERMILPLNRNGGLSDQAGVNLTSRKQRDPG